MKDNKTVMSTTTNEDETIAMLGSNTSLTFDASARIVIENSISENSMNAIKTIKDFIHSSISDPYYTNDSSNSTNGSIDDETYKLMIIPSSSRYETSIAASNIHTMTTPSKLRISEFNSRSNFSKIKRISNTELKVILDSIKTVFFEIILSVNDEIRSTNRGNDADKNHVYTIDHLEKMIRKIFELLINTVGYGNVQLFLFLLNDLLPMLSNGEKSKKYDHHHHELQQKRGNIIQILLEIIPLVIPNNIQISSEKKLVNLIMTCLFPKDQDGDENRYERKAKEIQNKHDNDRSTKRKNNLNSERYREHHRTNMEAGIKRTIQNEYSSYYLLNLIQSVINLFHRYTFKDEQLVLQIICDIIIPQIEGLKRDLNTRTNTTATTNDTNLTFEKKKKSIIILICHVIFMYLGIDNKSPKSINSKNSDGSNNSSNGNRNGYGSKSSESIDKKGNILDIAIHSIQIIRNMFLLEKKRQHTCYDIENNVIRNFIPLLLRSSSSSSLVNGYKTIIENSFTTCESKDSIHDQSRNQPNQNNWTKLDVCAFLIIYHCHHIHRKDMRQVIEELCNRDTFPFAQLKTILLIDFIKFIDQTHLVKQPKSTSNSSILTVSIMEMGLYLLMTPIRNPDYPRDETSHPSYYSNILKCDKDSGHHCCQSSSSKVKKVSLHPTRRVLSETKSFLETLFIILSSRKQEELVNSLLYLSSHTTFIPNLINRVTKEETDIKSYHLRLKPDMRKQATNDYPLPCYLDRFFPRSNVKTTYSPRNVYDIAIASLETLHNIVRDSHLHGGLDSSKIRRITIDRLRHLTTSHQYSIAKTNRGTTKFDIVLKDEIAMFQFLVADKYCSILVILSCQEGDGMQQLNNLKEMKELFHKLLNGSTISLNSVASSYTPAFLMNEKISQNSGKVIGIILGKNIISSPHVSDLERNIILKSILDLVLPPVSSSQGGSTFKPDPVLGYWSLCFFCACCPELTERGTKKSLYCDDKSNNKAPFSISAIFKHIKAMVSQTGIVKLESELLIGSNSKRTKQTTTLSYKNPPSCFRGVSKHKRSMVFCISSLSEKIMETNCNHDIGMETIQWMRFIHALIDVYLHMGRMISPNWSADAWLSASIELPRYNYDYPDATNDSELMFHFYEIDSEHHIPYQVSIQLAVSYLISISLSKAILTNAYEHFLSSKSNRARERLHKLIQFNLAKTYDLRLKFQKTIDFYHRESNENLKSPDFPSWNLFDLTAIGTRFFDSSMVPLPLLWTCIKGEINKWSDHVACFRGSKICDGKFLGVLNNTNRENFTCELWFKRLTLKDMMMQFPAVQNSAEQVKQMTGDIFPKEILPNLMDKGGVRTILQDTIELVMWLQPLKELSTKQQIDLEASVPLWVLIEQISSFLFESLDFLQSLVEAIALNDSSKDLAWLTSGVSRQHFIAQYTTQTLCAELAQTTFHINDPFISSKILDFVSLLSKHGNVDVEELLMANWNQFLCVRPEHGEGKCTKLPHSFAHLLNKELQNCASSSNDSNKSAVLLHLLKMVLNSSSENSNDHILCHHLCAHWANVTSNGSSFCREYHLLISCLQVLVNKLASDVMMDTDFKVVRGISAKTVQSRNIPIQSLFIRTIPLTYEILLSMSIASFVLKISEEDYLSNLSSQNARHTKASSPNHSERSNQRVETSLELVKIFGILVDLYTSNFKLFPEKTLSVTIRASSLMIKSFEIQIEKAFRVRQGNPQSTPRKKGINRNLLQPIFDCVQTYVALILDFCNAIPDSMAGEEVNETSLTNRKAIITLEVRCEGILSFLHEINGSYNYFLPSSLECLKVKTETVGPNQSHVAGLNDKQKKTIINKKRKKNENDEDMVFESLKVKESDDDNDSFGVIGDWGKDDVCSTSDKSQTTL